MIKTGLKNVDSLGERGAGVGEWFYGEILVRRSENYVQ